MRSSQLLDKLMRVAAPPGLQPPHGGIVDHKHNEVVQPNIVPIGIKPKGQDPLIHHDPLHHQSTQLGHHRRPHQILIIRLRNHQSEEGQKEGNDGALDLRLGDGELAGGVVEVEAAEGDPAGEEGKIVEVVVFVESVRTVDELGVAVVSLQHLVYEVEGRHARQDEKDREGTRGCLGQGLLHHCDLLVHHEGDLLLGLSLGAEEASGGEPPLALGEDGKQ